MSQDYTDSTYREKLIEHLFVGELLKISWLNQSCTLEIARPEVDNSGYDVIMEERGVMRHIQLKAASINGKAANQKVHIKLAEKPNGCVVWIFFDRETLKLGPFLFFEVSKASLEELDVAKHTKANKEGFKADRQNIRVVPKAKFAKCKTIDDLYAKLFGVTPTEQGGSQVTG